MSALSRFYQPRSETRASSRPQSPKAPAREVRRYGNGCHGKQRNFGVIGRDDAFSNRIGDSVVTVGTQFRTTRSGTETTNYGFEASSSTVVKLAYRTAISADYSLLNRSISRYYR